MKQKNRSHILKRYVWASFFILLFACDIIYNLFNTTVVHADAWNAKANFMLSKTSTVDPERGKILADDGSVLAADLHFYTARIDWSSAGIKEKSFVENIDALSDSLAKFKEGRTAAEWKKELKEQFYNEKKRKSYRLFSNLSHREYERLKSFPFFNLGRNKSGLYTEEDIRRCKPYGSMASRSIGKVGEVGEKSERHGLSGLEKALDSLLYGVPGVSKKVQVTKNIIDWESIAPQTGYDIQTTINVNLQDIVEEELYNMLVEGEAQWGTAILMETKSGEIKAISNLEWNDTFNDYVEGRNNAVLGYEPGSVMKPISMMVALEDGIVSNIDSVMVTGFSFPYAGGRPISDSHGAASMPVRQVIGSSSNIGMAKIILRKYEKRPDEFRQRLEQMGFFEPLNTGIAGQETPYFQKLGNKNWDRISLSRMAYGYTSRIPPMCTLAMYNAIANDGKYVRPRLVKALYKDGKLDSVVPESYIRQQVCSPKNAQKLRQMLHDVVWKQPCTAKTLQNDLVEIAGKTGTCYVIENKSYSHVRRFAFCGFFPYEHPMYTCMVLIKGGSRGAAYSSGTVLKNVALKMYSRGLLGEHSDYRADNEKNKDTKMTLYAAKNSSAYNDVASDLGVGSKNRMKSPSNVKEGVPNVIGLNIRDAISTLEQKGITAHISGAGYVVSQSIAAGTRYRKGQTTIKLILRH